MTEAIGGGIGGLRWPGLWDRMLSLEEQGSGDLLKPETERTEGTDRDPPTWAFAATPSCRRSPPTR